MRQALPKMLLTVAVATGLPSFCTHSIAADDDDALSLQLPGTAASFPAPPSDTRMRLYAEAAAGTLSRRGGLLDTDSRRFSVDYSQTFQPLPGWRLVLSDRFDDAHPTGPGEHTPINSLREAYGSWQAESGSTIIEFGRVNLRLGPAYGFNPTDYFREGALRAITTADPLALRENRMGTVMLRAQRLWQGGGLMVALAPKLQTTSSSDSMSVDLGATNHHNRALVALSGKVGERLNWQALTYAEQGRSVQIGANLTALISDAAVAHGEWSGGREADRLALSLGQQPPQHQTQRISAGLTYTTSTRLAVTGEYAYNGAAPDSASWKAAGATGGNALGSYLLDVQKRQDSGSRQAWLFYATQKSLGLKNLDLTGFVRVNAEDHSRFSWFELRYHWDRLDAALQWFSAQGQALSEYGVIPNRRSLQLLGAWYF